MTKIEESEVGESKILWAVAIAEKLKRQKRFLKELLKSTEMKEYKKI